MTQDKIREASGKYGTGRISEAREGFIDGAKWRIDSVWHNPNELPRKNKMLLTISGNFNTFICGPNTTDWSELVQDMNILKWAYVEDLVPDSFTKDRLESRQKKIQQAVEYLDKQETERCKIERRQKEGKALKTPKQISQWLQDQPWYESFRRQLELNWAHRPGTAKEILDGKDKENTILRINWDISLEGRGFWEKVDVQFLKWYNGEDEQ